MSYKIRKVFEDHIPTLLNEKTLLSESGSVNNESKKQLEKSIEVIALKLRYTNMRELNKMDSVLSNELLDIVKEKYSSNGNITVEMQRKEEEIELQVDILKKAIELKKDYQKKYAHPVERNIIEHGLFESSLPTNSTMARLRTPEGIIERHKNGFRRLYYRNDNGNYLSVFDSRALIGMMKIWKDKGENKVFEFDFKELLNAIEVELDGANYRMIANSLDNLARTQIIMEEYLDPRTQKRTKTKIHHPIPNAEIDRINNRAKVEFNSILQDSLKAGNYINISMSLFNDLANDTSKNLYMFIINYIQTKRDVEGERVLDIEPLIEQLGIHASTKTKKVNLIKDALEELKSYEILKTGEVVKVGRFYKYVRFEESPFLRTPNVIIGGNQLFI
ncbi:MULTISPECIES: RepB family plasmid replication initiator protein [Cytobacillus]|uniref:RepB family plasmid replication initiator protein n=1 Tax=Cytobacillus TaxID=2675230 RepID=UPI000550A6AB|nr:RepB family plasmid replication initiator protein [Cytobacillus oceanisediminis]MCM3403000.1 hypothetical protein [Cytobacillus oceanisediminis]